MLHIVKPFKLYVNVFSIVYTKSITRNCKFHLVFCYLVFNVVVNNFPVPTSGASFKTGVVFTYISSAKNVLEAFPGLVMSTFAFNTNKKIHPVRPVKGSKRLHSFHIEIYVIVVMGYFADFKVISSRRVYIMVFANTLCIPD